MIKAVELAAAPHTTEPTSKSRMDTRNVYLMLKKPYSLPKNSWKPALVRR
jgi:hypothetical protein